MASRNDLSRLLQRLFENSANKFAAREENQNLPQVEPRRGGVGVSPGRKPWVSVKENPSPVGTAHTARAFRPAKNLGFGEGALAPGYRNCYARRKNTRRRNGDGRGPWAEHCPAHVPSRQQDVRV